MNGKFCAEGKWSNEPVAVSGAMDLGFWSGVSVFDGARAIQGCAPDLNLHCERLIHSAKALGTPTEMTGAEVLELCLEGLSQLDASRDYYIRPMMFAKEGVFLPEAEGVTFTLAIFDMPLPEENAGTAMLSRFRRPASDQAPTDAKAGCLYPNSQRARREAVEAGHNLAVMLDPSGNVAEFSHANLWLAKDGAAICPTPNGTFLNGITKQRVTKLLRSAEVEVIERTVTVQHLHGADEIWTTGNAGKVQTITGFEDRALQPGPVFRAARELYMDFVKTCPIEMNREPQRSSVA